MGGVEHGGEMEDIVTDYELTHHVRQALNSVLQGDTDENDQLIGNMHNHLHLNFDEIAMILTILRALSGAVSCIHVVHHRSLLSSICGMSLWNYGPDVMDALLELVVALATSSGKYLDLCLDMLVSNFIPPFNFLEILKQPCGLAKKDQVISRLHSALKQIADLVPLAPSRLEQIVRERQIVVYVENMLTLESGDIGELVGNSMIFELVNRLIDLDVEIGWDEILLDDPSKGIFEMELEDLARPVDQTDMDMDEPQRVYSGQKVLWGNVVAQKLDTLMVLTFDHLQFRFKSGRLVQNECCFISCKLPVSCKVLVCFVCDGHIRKSGKVNPKHHRVFYAGCQAIMYVLCFRMRSILAIPPLKSQLLNNKSLEQILRHELNPLEVCLPSIVDEFLRQAKAARLFRVSGSFAFHDLLESDMSRAFGGFERLDLFFPFDPYLLKKSDRYIREHFIYWSMVKTTYDDDDDDGDEEGISDDEEEEDENGVSNGRGYEDNEFDMNLNKMSITPPDSFMFVNDQVQKMQMPSRIRRSTNPESL